ncbi:MAG: sigma 54-interacting transcriptional regulator [Deltaproteobacteria bacterium]|nr:sigma 54-interacting transcriptional regulator [Deltaproteobacteria bacterium]
MESRPIPNVAKCPEPLEQPLPRLLEKVLARALLVTASESGAILIVDEDTGDLAIECSALRGELLAEPPPRLLLRGARTPSIGFRTVDERQPVLCEDVHLERCALPIFRDSHSHLSAPIVSGGRVLGVIATESPRAAAHGPEAARALEELCAEVAVGVRRSLLQRDSSQRAGARGRGIMFCGISPAWEEAERRMERAADTNATVLLRGESGTGKELAAHAIHFMSRRARSRFVVVNCGAIPDGLLESELFGHVRGAFTGAATDRPGRFEEADGGTFFLDEVGELSLPLQVKLLRVLESGEVRRVGASGPQRRVDVRVIAATNRPLEQMIRDGSFREDLYYRLNVVSVRMPALREYREAIPAISRAMLREFAHLHGRAVRDLDPEALVPLLEHDFPGNLRELRNLIEQAVVLETSELLRPANLPEEVRSRRRPGEGDANDAVPSYREAVREFERGYLTDLLSRHHGDVPRAAVVAGVHRVQLYRMVRRHGLDLGGFRLEEAVAQTLPASRRSAIVLTLPTSAALLPHGARRGLPD